MDIKNIKWVLSQIQSNEDSVAKILAKNEKWRKEILEELAKAPLLVEEFIVDENAVKNDIITKEMKDAFYNSIGNIEKVNKSALFIYMMDTTGSMGIWERFIAKAYYIWTKKILQAKHNNIETVLIGHDVEAKVYSTEKELFSNGSGGGTVSSSALIKSVSSIAQEKYYGNRDIYVVYASDGDNLSSDNARCVKVLENEILNNVKLFNYFEINAYNRHSTLSAVFSYVNKNNFVRTVIKSKEEMLKHLRKFKDKI